MRAAAADARWLSGTVDGRSYVGEGHPGAVPRKPRLLDQVRDALRVGHYSRRTERAYVGWIRRYIPAEMGAPEASRFLSSLAVDGKVSASTQNGPGGAAVSLRAGAGARATVARRAGTGRQAAASPGRPFPGRDPHGARRASRYPRG